MYLQPVEAKVQFSFYHILMMIYKEVKLKKILIMILGIGLLDGVSWFNHSYAAYPLPTENSEKNISNKELLKEIRIMKQTIAQQAERIADLEVKLEKQESALEGIETNEMSIEDFDMHVDSYLLHRIPGYELVKGLRIGLGATSVLQNAHNANGDNVDAKEDATDAPYSFDLEFDKKLEDYGTVFTHLETGDGVGVDNDLKVFSNVNRDSDDCDNIISLTEVWYEHYLKKTPLTLTIGKIDSTVYVDKNEYANDETTQFLGNIFRNSPTVEFPDNSVGVHFGLEPVDFMDAHLLLMEGDSDWEDIFHGNFFAAELNFKPKLFDRDGNYRILGWVNSQDHTKWNDASKTREKGFGFGLSFDQEITDIFGIFARYGWQNPEQRLNGLDDDFSLEHSWSSGVQIKGGLWNREDDVLAFAVGQAIPSDDYKKAGTDLKAKEEGHFEAYYSFKLNDHLALGPDI